MEGGFKVVVSGRKSFDEVTWAEVLKLALEQVKSRLAAAEQGGETAAA